MIALVLNERNKIVNIKEIRRKKYYRKKLPENYHIEFKAGTFTKKDGKYWINDDTVDNIFHYTYDHFGYWGTGQDEPYSWLELLWELLRYLDKNIRGE